MNAKQPKKAKRPPGGERPFPWLCRHCGERKVALAKTDYAAEVRHDGRLHEFTIADLELPVCQACGERVFTEDVDGQFNDALRAHLNLLTPAQIRDAIERVGISQKDMAKRLRIAEATLSRWLGEVQIQSRSMDNLLRLFFAFPDVRDALPGGSQDPQLGLSDAIQTSLPRHSRSRPGKKWPDNPNKEQSAACKRVSGVINGAHSTWGRGRV